jgi:glycosyltransferase involved in cell wall biosynthesis
MLRVSARLGHPGPPEIRYPDLTAPLDEVWPRWIDANKRRMEKPIATGHPLKVTQYIGSLNAGGAERQLCTAASALVHRGVDVRVLTTKPLENEYGHYQSLLHGSGVQARQAMAQRLSPAVARELPWHLLRTFPSQLRQNVLTLAADLAADLPDVLHCWLDQTNLIGGVAGLLTGVPAIVLGLRSVNPSHFPDQYLPGTQQWYAVLARSCRVHLVANSQAAAASYAEWIGVPLERIAVIRNGLDASNFPQNTPKARHQARRGFRLCENDRVVSGVFRLSEEKQPEVFLDVLRRTRASVPALQVLLAGAGPMQEHIAEVVRSEGMSEYVQLLGRRTDVGTILLASDAHLLTSRTEGCPNVALEAQALGVPIIATGVDGTLEAVDHGTTGLLAPVGDAAALAGHLTRVLADEALRTKLAASGPVFVARRFGMERLLSETLALYSTATQGAGENRCRSAAA